MSAWEKVAVGALVVLALILGALTLGEVTRAVAADECASRAHQVPSHLQVPR